MDRCALSAGPGVIRRITSRYAAHGQSVGNRIAAAHVSQSEDSGAGLTCGVQTLDRYSGAAEHGRIGVDLHSRMRTDELCRKDFRGIERSCRNRIRIADGPLVQQRAMAEEVVVVTARSEEHTSELQSLMR